MTHPPFESYIQAGLSCFPIRADGSKAPAVAWNEFRSRYASAFEYQSWEDQYQGIALVCGAMSGNLEVLDIDEPSLVRPFIDALKSQDQTLLDRLTMIRTPRRNLVGKGGCHLVYRCEEAVGGNSKLAMSEPEPEFDGNGDPLINPNTGKQNMKPRTLIETRGEGGYVLTTGCSAECHETGNTYDHVFGPALTETSTLTAAEVGTIHLVARMFDRSVSEIHVDPKIHGYEGGGESPGDAYNSQATWAEILEPYGWVSCGESGGIKRWRRPGKATGISATTGVLSKAGNELLTVFSTNAYPFEGVGSSGRIGVTYSKFGAYATLNHKSDYQAAAQSLVKLGFGKPAVKTERKKHIMRVTFIDAERNFIAHVKSGTPSLHTLGIKNLDDALGGGVERGELVIVGGRPSHGKSVVALQALKATVEQGHHCILVSHEMSQFALAKRMILTRTEIEQHEWQASADALLQESTDYWEACGELFLLEQCRNIVDIENEVAKICGEYDIAMVAVDHAQLTQGVGGNRYEQLTDASGRLKELAMARNSVCLLPSQMNRDAAKGEFDSHNLKETGALEQDADVVILLRWPWMSDMTLPDTTLYEIKIKKNKNRGIMTPDILCNFDAEHQTLSPRRGSHREPRERFGEFDNFRGDDYD